MDLKQWVMFLTYPVSFPAIFIWSLYSQYRSGQIAWRELPGLFFLATAAYVVFSPISLIITLGAYNLQKALRRIGF